jgi:polyhydroxybutyrate depolymerase
LAPRARIKMMGRFMVLLTAFIAALGVATYAGANIVNKIEAPSSTTTYSMKVGSLTRSWEVIAPRARLPKSAPIIVVLSGIAAPTNGEITRDELVPYVNADKAELVYPVAYKESWNAIGCCGAAAKAKVNDVGFLEALVPKVDPTRSRPIYFAGYSNGGRMAYRLECTDPGLFSGMVAVKADPEPGCVVTKPQNVLVLSAVNDPAVPYKPGDKGRETPPATVQIARLQKHLKCSGKPTTAKHGGMTLYKWSCADRKTLEWALYQSGAHDFPPPAAATPGANQLIYSFASKTALGPVPT